MPRTKRVLASDLSLAELKRLLVAKEQIAPLEKKKAKLEAELASVTAQLAKLAGVPARRGRKPGRKPGRPAAKKAGRPVGKKVGRKAAKKVVRRVAKKARRRPGGLVDVVAKVIRENGKPMAFQAILDTIVKRKLYKTQSKNFANVLRRTISGSKAFKRVARATYGV